MKRKRCIGCDAHCCVNLGLMLVRGPQALAPVLAGLVVWAVVSGQDPRLIPVALLEMGVGAWVGVQAYRRLWRRATGALADMLQTHGIDPRTLCFEITESQAISNREHARQLIEALRALGASVSLDDFGTGLATFDYLKSFPFDYLKIDGSFVKTLEHSPVDQAIVRSITEVARCMGLATIAEFVESDGTAQLLRRFGVDYAQGYALGKPRPLAEILQEAEVPANS